MSTIFRDGETTTRQETAQSKPSSLMTDEDWDQLLAKEQQENGGIAIKEESTISPPSLDLICGSVSPLKVGGGNKSTHASPIKVGKDSGQYSTPSSPSELLRLTRRNTAAGDENGSTIEEATQFEKELGDWINNEHSPFEDDDTLRQLKVV